MKRFRPSLRRVLSVAIAGIAGAAATLFLATPAFAHHVNTKGIATCDPSGGWTVTWEVASGGNWKKYYKITAATSTPADGQIGGELGSLATAYKEWDQKFTGKQHFAASVASATLNATAKFSNSVTSEAKIVTGGSQIKTKVNRPNCDGPPSVPPSVAFASTCNNSVTVTLDNQQGRTPVTFNVKGSDEQVGGGQTIDVIVPGAGGVVVKLAGHADWTYAGAVANRCVTATPATPTTTTPGLADTGASAGGPLGIGAALLAAGVGLIALVFRMRRRRSLAGQ